MMVSPFSYSRRALLIERRMAGVIVLSSLMLATRTDATPRISFNARLMSSTSALSSSVIIICDALSFDVTVAIIIIIETFRLQRYKFFLIIE